MLFTSDNIITIQQDGLERKEERGRVYIAGGMSGHTMDAFQVHIKGVVMSAVFDFAVFVCSEGNAVCVVFS